MINGQKLWTSLAHEANWIFVLARTDPDAPRHQGISFLLVPLDQPGVEVRPIRDAEGRAASSTRCSSPMRITPAANVVGEVNNGWAVANTLLGFERGEEAATYPICGSARSSTG